jgi:hypothetical protein
MEIYFKDEKDAKTFLELCRAIAKVLEENEKLRKT